MIRKRKYKIHTCVRTSVYTCSESRLFPGNYDKLNHTYSRDTPAEPSNKIITHVVNLSNELYPSNQGIEHNKKLIVKLMANDMKIVRSNGVTAILNPPTWNVDIDSVVVTPSKTHVSYYDVTLYSVVENHLKKENKHQVKILVYIVTYQDTR